MRAARVYGAKDIRVENVELEKVKKDEVKIEVEWCGICGSDKNMYLNPFNRRLPVTLGHEFSGTVVEIGEDVSKIKVGDRVVVNPIFTCGKCVNCKSGYPNLCENLILFGYYETYGAFGEYTIVKEDMVIKIPDELAFDKAALVEPASIAAHAVRISKFRVGDTVAVFGAGPIGLFLVSLLKAAGARHIFVIGHTEERLQKALKLGATHAMDPDKEDVVKTIAELTEGGVVDIAFDAAGAQQTFTLGLSILRTRGEMVIVSLPHGGLQFDAISALHREIKITTSQCTLDEFPIMVDFLARDKISAEGIITKKIHLDDIVQEGFETMLKDKSNIKILVTPKRENL
jgi:(R,R)-butanediol dehydrogenase/meso-butanediol dehydrogenase/diacetyl reductase